MPRSADEESMTALPRWMIQDVRELISTHRTPIQNVKEYVRHCVAEKIVHDKLAQATTVAHEPTTFAVVVANPSRQGEAGDDLSQAPGIVAPHHAHASMTRHVEQARVQASCRTRNPKKQRFTHLLRPQP
jgi:hypothetical protein